jgi:predicted MarR family transcription regulator
MTFETSIGHLQDLIATVKRGLDRIENNQYSSLEDLQKTLRVMSSVCEKAARDVKLTQEVS